MATEKSKLQPSQVEKLKKIGITVKEHKGETAKAKDAVIVKLEKEEIDRSIVEDETLDVLIDMYCELTSTSSDDDAEEEFNTDEETTDEESTTEEELDELADETTEDDGEEEEEIIDLEDEEEVPAAKPTKTVAKPAASAKPAAKPAAKPTPKPSAKAVANENSNKFDARNNKAHLEYLEPFEEIFDKEDYQFDILKQGFTVRRLLKNNKPTIINFDELKIVDGELFGNFYANRFKNPEELIQMIGDDYEDREIGMFRGESHPCVRKMTQTEVLSILNDTNFLEFSIKRADGIDAKLGESKDKLEQTLNKKYPAPVAKAAATTAKTTTPVAKKPVPAAAAAPVKKAGGMPPHLAAALAKRKADAEKAAAKKK